MLIFLEVNIDGQRSLKCHVTNFFLTSCGLQYLQKKTTIIFRMSRFPKECEVNIED